MSNERLSRAISGGLAFAGLVILADQVSAILPPLYPFKPADLLWRNQAANAVMARLTALLIGQALLIVAAAVLGSRAFSRILGVFHLLLAAVIGVGIVSFLLDSVQLRAALTVEAKRPFTIGAVRILGLAGLWAMFEIWTAIGLFLAKPRPKASSAEEATTLIVGGARGSK